MSDASRSGKGLRMIVNLWSKHFTKLYGHHFPESYLCVDTEYTGGNAEKDLIYEIGHVMVENRQVVDKLSVVIDWTDHPIVPEDWVRHALRRAELRRQEVGQKMHVTWKVMKEEGVKPEEALQFYWELFRRIKERNLVFVAHHGYFADERMLKGHFEGFMGKQFRFGENGMFDTGAIEKASQCVECQDPMITARRSVWIPQPADTLESYFRRVVYAPAKGIFWNLEHCAQKYDLYRKFALDPEGHHTADFDALVCHYLMEEFRSRIVVSHASEENPFTDATTLERAFDLEIAKAKQANAQQRAHEDSRDDSEAPGERLAVSAAPQRPFSASRRRRGQRPV